MQVLIVAIGVASAATINGARAATLEDQAGSHTVLCEVPGTRNQPQVDQTSPPDQTQREPVNPVPLSPQLWTALATLGGAMIYRHRRPMLKWLA